MISGLHAPNESFTGEDYRIVGVATAKTVNVFATEATKHTFEG